MLKKLQHKLALSPKGARNLVKASFACTLTNLALMFPVGLLFFLVSDLMHGSIAGGHGVPFYIIGTIVCIVLIWRTNQFQYQCTFYATYVESGVRRTTLAEKLRTLPLSFFGKKDLSDLTSTIMADCSTLETMFSHWYPELVGALISTALVAVGILAYTQMALAALRPLPVAFRIVGFSAKVQEKMNRSIMKAKMDCAGGIRECLETVRDLKANNAEKKYLAGLDKKIFTLEKRLRVNEFGTAVFVVSAQLILKVGIATTALVGCMLMNRADLDILTFFMFLLLVSRLYDPLQNTLINLAAIISARVNISRMNEVLDCPVQTGTASFQPKGSDIVFDHVGFAYENGKTILKNVSFTAEQGEVTALIGPSGGGKTTASRLAARFWDCTRGRVTVGGTDVSTVDPETLLTAFSIVFQDVTLFNNTVLENIRIGKKSATNEEVLQGSALCSLR